MTREELTREREASAARQAARRMYAEICSTAAATETEILDAVAAKLDALDADAGARWANALFSEIFESA